MKSIPKSVQRLSHTDGRFGWRTSKIDSHGVFLSGEE